jgi:hypothetical protein
MRDIIGRDSERTREDENLEIRTVAEPVDRIARRRLRRPVVRNERHKLAACGKSHDADTRRVDSVILRMCSDPADGAAHIGRRIFYGVM